MAFRNFLLRRKPIYPPGARQGRLWAWQQWQQVMLAVVLVLAFSACSPDDVNTAPTVPAMAATSMAGSPLAVGEPTATNAAPTPAHCAPTPQATATPTATQAPTRTLAPATATPTLQPGWVRVPAGPVQVPILMYHHISDKINTRYALPISTFRAQMAYLHKEGYQTVSVSALADVIRGGGSLPEKAVVITFDDGYLDTYANALPVMEEFGFTGVVYIITSTLDEGMTYGYMQRAELRALARAGWEIGSHGISHTNLKETKLGAGNEMVQSKARLEKLLGVPVRSFSYPFAVSTEALREQAEKSGYDSAVGVDILVTNTPRRMYYLSRREVSRSLSLVEFQRLLAPSADEIAWLQRTLTPDGP